MCTNVQMRMQERMLTRAGLAEKDRIVSLRARAFREAESLIRKPSLHASSKSTSESPHAFASLRPSPIRSLRSPSRRKDGSDETWDSVVDRSKARIQSAIDGLHLVLGKLKQDSELSTNTPSTADSERDTNQNRSSNNNTPSSPRPVPEQDSPTDGDRRRRHTSETGTPSVVRSLKWDLDDAATREADDGSADEARLAPQKDWAVNEPAELAVALHKLQAVQQAFNAGAAGGNGGKSALAGRKSVCAPLVAGAVTLTMPRKTPTVTPSGSPALPDFFSLLM